MDNKEVPCSAKSSHQVHTGDAHRTTPLYTFSDFDTRLSSIRITFLTESRHMTFMNSFALVIK